MPTDEQIDRLKRGGHDLPQIYAAFAEAANATTAGRW
jgi:pyruvate dehydrogenase complex dehydrogenase (E1) component